MKNKKIVFKKWIQYLLIVIIILSYSFIVFDVLVEYPKNSLFYDLGLLAVSSLSLLLLARYGNFKE